MMAPDSKKNAAAMIIASMKPSPEQASEPVAEVDGHEAAASEIMDAIEAKDPQALKEALKSFVQMCQDEEYSEPLDSPAEESAE